MGSANSTRCRLCGKTFPEDGFRDGLCPVCGSFSPAEDSHPTADKTTTATSDEPSSRDLPDRIGPYKVLDFLGEGGMGVVYLAEQEQPIRRKVALKIIKLGMDTKEVIARFESERQALAMMNHPNIAQVHDAGTTDRGAPYFVMEYVPGLPIGSYCDKNRLSTRERLELFIPLCQAIQHAHQKGIIHRDIKPSNVLVAVQDEKAVPKIIDFGVAKAINQRLTERTVFTQQGHLIGTPEYMSPEQAEMTGLDVDTTTDIYSLGVLLYELLVGALPFDPKALRRAGFDEIRRIIREVDPPKPTTRLSSLGPMAKEIAERRHTDVGALERELGGDLEWITLKAMEKDRTRRYASSSELAADIERHLRNEPVIACPPSPSYRLRKFVRRHRMGVCAAAGAFILLAAFGLTMALQAQRIARERDRTRSERDRAERVSAFLVSMFEASDPDKSKGSTLTARELLDRGLVRLQGELKEEPRTRASLFHTIGRVFMALDRMDPAKGAFEQALAIRRTLTGPDRIELAETLNELGNIERHNGHLDRAEADHLEALEIRREFLGNANFKVAGSLVNLGNIELDRGRLEEAEKDYREAELVATRAGSSDVDLAKIQANVAIILERRGKLDDAIQVYRNLLSVLQRRLGRDHTLTLNVMNNLSSYLFRAGNYEEAEGLQRELAGTRRKILGDDHTQVGYAFYNLGNTLDELGRFTEAEEALKESLRIWRKSLPQPHVQVAWALNDLGIALQDGGKLVQAAASFQQALAIFEKAPGAEPVDAAWAWQGLGDVAYAQGRPAEAQSDYRTALKLRQSAPGASPSNLADSEASLGRSLCASGSTQEGERMLRDALDIRQRVLPASHWRIAYTQALLGRCLSVQSRFVDAEPLLLNGYELLRAKRGDGREETREIAAGIVALYEAWGKPDRAALYRNQAGPRVAK